ncbi:Oxaloacetate decarboxylase, gamma chain [Anaerosphaera aminiphila DSM 21120]|uniref:Oxaloacetate decarboxylase, gamma chain n=1 Tax=Anaerosphaera aminiphila DSM 21120 TaxID=1120995 RepID=A0A1M5PUM6_9FIRM|nr:OadG-related small transporter subunit [Anaerosphaera aminiphila]SHH05149.1 Oxaloacetate decarboxylase, gamma chain [Anaerosphaera aminiphila DSM 21120]
MDALLMKQGLEVAVLGLAGVFAVLILFYISVKVMLVIFKNKK